MAIEQRTDNGRRMGLWATTTRGLVFTAPFALAVLLGAGACVEIDQDPAPDWVIMEFDTTAQPARVPEPNVIVINPQTGLIDFSTSGLEVPENCADATGMPLAQCEFYQYLETLDGFPTLSTVKAPSTELLDLDTVTMPDNLLIINATNVNIMLEDKVALGVDATDIYLTVDPLEGWDVGSTYLVAIRGYDDGVRSAAGKRVITNQTYFLLKEEEPLTCGAATPETIPEDCKYLELLAPSYGREAAATNLFQLEALRQGFESQDVWGSVEVLGDMDKEEVAMVWAFPTHSASVAELQPAVGVLPHVVSARELRIDIKGSVGASIVAAYHPVANPHGNVYLVDVTELMQNNQNLAFPLFTASYSEIHEAVVLEPEQDLVDGHLYCLILRDTLTNAEAEPLVASPVTVFLRSRGALVDEAGHSNVSSLDDASAAQLEVGRASLQEMLDNPDFQSATKLDEREEIVYLYAFTYPDPTTAD
jgi:hypothetical protein